MFMKVLIPLLQVVTFSILLQSSAKSQNNIRWTPSKETKSVSTIIRDRKIFISKSLSLKIDKNQPKEIDRFIFIDPKVQFEKFIGFGGAVTDAAAEVYAKLSASKQKEFVNAYYGVNGLNYNIVRTNMGSCDFSSDSYSYVQAGDSSLKTFSIKHDLQYRIPLLQKIKTAIGQNDMKLYISPWSPPSWMKDNNSLLYGGHLKQNYYQSWANYFVKYIKALEENQLPVWGLTVQNEPMASQIWESCVFSAEQEANFLSQALGPTLWKNKMKNKKVIIWDHNRDLIYQYASDILHKADAEKYVWGIGIHWYETWNSPIQLFDNEKVTKEAFPSKQLIFTEGCLEKFDLEDTMSIRLAEKYGNNILNDLNNGVVAWTDWNILLDENGGPNHVGNYCFAPIHANLKTGNLIYTSAYYYISHFAKYILPNARRIAVSSNIAEIQITGFINKNGQVVLEVLNTSEKDQKYTLKIENKSVIGETPNHSISTYLL